MTATQRIDAETLDREYEKMLRRERYLVERDKAHGVIGLTDATARVIPDKATDFDTGLMFWDTLKSCDHETALYLVLRHCLDYSVLEISAGLNVSYSRVKYMTLKAAKRLQRRR